MLIYICQVSCWKKDVLYGDVCRLPCLSRKSIHISNASMLFSVCLEYKSAGWPNLTYSTPKCPIQKQRPARGISTINLARVQCQPHSSIARMRGYMPAGDVNRSTQATRTLARETLTPAGRGQAQVICYCNE